MTKGNRNKPRASSRGENMPTETLPERAERRTAKATNRRNAGKPATKDYMPRHTGPKTF